MTVTDFAGTTICFSSEKNNNRKVVSIYLPLNYFSHWKKINGTVKFLNFWTQENLAVINLKFKQRGKTY